LHIQRVAPYLHGLIASVFSLLVTLPFLFMAPLPEEDVYGFPMLALAVLVAILAFWKTARASRPGRRLALAYLGVAALPCLIYPFVLRVLERCYWLDRLLPNLLASLFKLDGEQAYDAVYYGLWCELWLVLTPPLFLALWYWQRRRGSGQRGGA
jgi:hypothetical protein